MMENRAPSLIPETQPSPNSLDAEIIRVRHQITTLTNRRAMLVAASLSSPNSQTLLARAKAHQNPAVQITSLEKRIKDQNLQNVQNSYRMCAGATMFEGRDPDPNAVDEGRIVGVRIEVFNRRTRTFRPPYYLLLNRPRSASPSLSIHRHTIPQCIPLQCLASKYLPLSAPSDEEPPKIQNLARLVQELRRELVSYHLRQDAIEKLGERTTDGISSGQRNGVKEVEAVDAENRDFRVVWEDGTVARIVVGNGGGVEKVVILDEEKNRKREMERKMLGAGAIEKLAMTLS